MTKVQLIQDEIIKLDHGEFAELMVWMKQRDNWDEWDLQMEEDAKSGALDELMEAAHRDHREGKSTKF